MGNRAVKSVAVAGVALLAVTTLLVESAAANNWVGATGAQGCGANMQDNSTMTYSRVALSSSMFNEVAWVLNNVVAPTDISLAAEQATPTSNTDVVYQEANYVGGFCGFTWHSAGNLIGYTYCASLSGQRCQRFNIYIDQSWEVNVTNTSRRWIACHESGHSLGLTHPTSSSPTTTCMSSSGSTYHSTHEVSGHINGNY